MAACVQSACGAASSASFTSGPRDLGCGIAVLSFITLIISYRRLNRRATTSWDQGRHLVLHRPATTGQQILNVIGVVLIPICYYAMQQLE